MTESLVLMIGIFIGVLFGAAGMHIFWHRLFDKLENSFGEYKEANNKLIEKLKQELEK